MVTTASDGYTASVLALLVCRDGVEWLPDVLAGLRQQTVRPRHLLAVDLGSTDRIAELLVPAGVDDEQLFDEVLTLPAGTRLAEAVSRVLEHAVQSWEDPDEWLWLVHDDSAPEPECLQNLLAVAEAEPAAAMLGPLGLDWADPRWVVDAGVSTDSSGHCQTGLGLADRTHPAGPEQLVPSELDPALVRAPSPLPVVEVLAVSSACALLRRDVFERLGGFDFRPARADIDLGWRINVDGSLVLSVPHARMRHARGCEAQSVPAREGRSATLGQRLRTAERVQGVRTFLVNTSACSFALGVPRAALLALLRACGFALLRRWPEATAECSVLGRLVSGRMGLRSARSTRRRASATRHEVRHLLTRRRTRWRNGLQSAFARLVRERVRRDLLLERAPTVPAEPVPAHPAGAKAWESGSDAPRVRPVAGLRRSGPIVMRVPKGSRLDLRPSPTPREPAQELLQVPLKRGLVLRQLFGSPAVVLTALLVLFALFTQGVLTEFGRFGTGLHGGRLLPPGDLQQTWTDYLAAWHPVHGGTGAPAPVSLLVLAVLGTVLVPLGGPPAAVAVLILFGVPLAGLTAYHATRWLPVPRRWRAWTAAAYALLPAATLSAAQGRLDVVVAHVLLPPLLSGIAQLTGLAQRGQIPISSEHWLGTACLTSLGLALLGAFSPLMHAVFVVLALVGYVVMPTEMRRAPRRVAGIAALVLLPVLCLLPWSLALIKNPQILLHGLGARITEIPAGAWLVALSPDHSPSSAAGAGLVLVALAAVIAAPVRTVLPGAVVALAGWAVSILVDTVTAQPIGGGAHTTGWAGAPLLLVAAGLLWTVLATGSVISLPRRIPIAFGVSVPVRPRLAKSALVVALLLLASAAALSGHGGKLTATPEPVAISSGAVLIAEPGPQPARLAWQRPHFGDDDLVPAGGAVDWLHRVDAELLSGDPRSARAGLAAVAVRGVDALVVPAETATHLRAVAGEAVTGSERPAGPGQEVLLLRLPSSPVGLLGPDLARHARIEEAPSAQARPLSVSASLPNVAVRVSDGGLGRVLLLSAENEAGWQARIDGMPVPLATAWGHQVAVPLPENAGEVSITYTEATRTTLLVVQGAAILFTMIGALPRGGASGRMGRAG